MPLKVKEMYEARGEPERAAEAALRGGAFAEAARIFKQTGRADKAAEALEAGGSLLAAAREYREAGNYIKAAELLKEGGMPREAAEMYKISLTGAGEINASNLHRYYAYASFLAGAGEAEEAGEMLEKISAIDPEYKDVRERLGQAAPTPISPPAAQAPAESPRKGLQSPRKGLQAPADAESGLLESHRYIGEEPPKQPEQLEPVITEFLRRETTLRAIMNDTKIKPR